MPATYRRAKSIRIPAKVPSIAVIVAVSVCALVLRSGYPINALAFAGFDDALFIREAVSLRSLHWLGAYDNLTLAKGMFYPLFITASSVVQVPLIFAEQVLYLAACLLTALIFRNVTGGRYYLIVFAVLALNPIVFDENLSRVIREAIYVSLSLALFVLVFAMLFPQRETSRRSLTMATIATGVVTACYWLTREEAVWILPAIGFLIAAAIVLAIAGRIGKRLVLTRLVLISASMVGAASLVALVAGINYLKYGAFTDVEFRSRGFLSAYGAVSRVTPQHWTRYVALPKDVRERLYEVSPAFAELKPYFEGPPSAGFKPPGCGLETECNAFLMGWFMWALRDGVAYAGHYASHQSSEQFYRRLAAEIDTACETGALNCGAPRRTMLPPFRFHYMLEAAARLPGAARVVFTLGGGNPYYRPIGSDDQVELFRRMTGLIAESAPHLRGWAAATSGEPRVRVAGSEQALPSLQAADVDIAMASRRLKASRFDTEGKLTGLQVTLPTGDIVTILATDIRKGLVVDRGDVVVFLDEVPSTVPATTLWSRENRARIIAIVETLRPAYSAFLIIGVLMALVGGVWSLLRGETTSIFIAVLSFGAIIAALSRCALLAYMDVSTFQTLNILYLSPAVPFLSLSAVLGPWLLRECLATRRTVGAAPSVRSSATESAR